MQTLSIPLSFFDTHYDGAKYPGSPECRGLKEGANCQYFAYELLRHFARPLPDFRSSDLWEDETFTQKVSTLEPLDLLLFNKDENAYGAHVGVYLGNDLVLHLAKEVGYPTIWSLEAFQKNERYRVLIGAKRVKAPL